ncbi:MAG: SurA N-terminal domain-containing protein, partial [Gammaproteobacteria bacterium]|nr:SurA N-terminal domain-containing protein [Gammaproteobacteria bacterium]
MLQRLRDSLVGNKVVAYIVLLPLALVFAAWGAYGVVNMDVFAAADRAAEVNGRAIGREEVLEAWQDQQSDWQQRFGGEIPAEQVAELQQNLLESFVRNALVTERAADAGYRVPRERIDEVIANLPAFQIEGKYNEAQALAVLANRGISQEKFRADLRVSLQNQELQRAIQVSNFATPNEIERRLALEDEQREVALLTLPAERFAGPAPSDAELQQWLERHAADYQTPESVRLQFGELRLEQMAAQVVVTEDD